MKQRFITLLALLSAAATPALSQGVVPSEWPEAQPEWEGSIIARASIRVKSIDESLKLYRDILGLQVFYTPPQLPLNDFGIGLDYDPAKTVKFAVIRSEMAGDIDPSIGQLGLAEIYNEDGTPDDPQPVDGDKSHIGEVWFTFAVEDVFETYEKVKAAGYEVNVAPEKQPSGYNSGLMMRGPDGEKLYISDAIPRALLVKPRPKE